MFTYCTYVQNNSPLACHLVRIKMEIIVLMPNGPIRPPPPFLFIQFIQITSLNKRHKKSFDLVSFEDTQIESLAVAGDTSAQAGWSGFCPGPCRDWGDPRCLPWSTPGWGWGGCTHKGKGLWGLSAFSGAGSVDVQEMEQCFCGLCRRCP